jgi:hypothetical protein
MNNKAGPHGLGLSKTAETSLVLPFSFVRRANLSSAARSSTLERSENPPVAFFCRLRGGRFRVCGTESWSGCGCADAFANREPGSVQDGRAARGCSVMRPASQMGPDPWRQRVSPAMGSSARLSSRRTAQARRQPSTRSNSNPKPYPRPCRNPNAKAGLPRPLPPCPSPQPNARPLRVAWRASLTRVFHERCARRPEAGALALPQDSFVPALAVCGAAGISGCFCRTNSQVCVLSVPKCTRQLATS